MRTYYNGLIHKTVSKEASKEEIKNLLFDLTDSDFNGENGEEYYTEIEVDGETREVSRLEARMLEFNEFTNIKEFIGDVIRDNYSDSYYVDCDLDILEIDNTLVIALSSTYSC